MPATLSTSEDLLLSAGGAAAANSNASASPEATKKEESVDDKDGDGNGMVKANKGMILRKSVEYIRCVSLYFISCPFYANWGVCAVLPWRRGGRARESEEERRDALYGETWVNSRLSCRSA